MTAMLIVHKPGQCPRIGYTIGDEAESLRKWQQANPGAAIYVIQSSVDLPPPGTAWVQSSEEFLQMDDALNDLGMEEHYFGGY